MLIIIIIIIIIVIVIIIIIVRSVILCLRGSRSRRRQLDFVDSDLQIENINLFFLGFFFKRIRNLGIRDFILFNSFSF